MPDKKTQSHKQTAAEQSFGRYKIVQELGAGGMGKVYKAKDPQLGREVAIKVLLAKSCAGSSHISRFMREARAMASLKHENIIQILDIGGENKDIFLVMEYIKGKTLAQEMKDYPPSIPEALQMMETISGAVSYMHKKKILHRDLKPANIMIDENGKIKVMDLGLVKVFSRSDPSQKGGNETSLQGISTAIHPGQSRQGMITGSVGYMAPEQFDGISDERSDVYSLGVILYEMLTGIMPFQGETAINVLTAQMKGAEPPSKYRQDIPKEIENLCMKAIRSKSDERYQSVQEFRQDIQKYSKFAPKWTIALAALALVFALLLASSIFLPYTTSKSIAIDVEKKAPVVVEKTIVVMPEASIRTEIKEIAQELAEEEITTQKLKECKERLQQLSEKTKQDDFQAQILFLKAQVYEKSGQYADACEMYGKSLHALKSVVNPLKWPEPVKIKIRAALTAWEAKKLDLAKKYVQSLQKEHGEQIPQKNLVELAILRVRLAWEEKDIEKTIHEYRAACRTKMEKSISSEEFQPLAEILFTMARNLVQEKQYEQARIFLRDVEECFKTGKPYWNWLYFSSVCDFYAMKNSKIDSTPQAWKKVQDQFDLICQRSSELSSSAFFFCAYLQMKSGEDASYPLKQAEKRFSSSSQNYREFLGLLEDRNFLKLVMRQETLSRKLSEIRLEKE